LDMLAKHAMENILPGFHSLVQPGDFIVAGENFGCGSSREQAPQIIKHIRVSAVVAKSFARLFFRNAINIGLLLIICNTDPIIEGDVLEYRHELQQLAVPERELFISTPAMPRELWELIEAGGLLEYVKRKGGL